MTCTSILIPFASDNFEFINVHAAVSENQRSQIFAPAPRNPRHPCYPRLKPASVSNLKSRINTIFTPPSLCPPLNLQISHLQFSVNDTDRTCRFKRDHTCYQAHLCHAIKPVSAGFSPQLLQIPVTLRGSYQRDKHCGLAWSFDHKFERFVADTRVENSGQRFACRDTHSLRMYHVPNVASPVALIPH